MPRVHTKEFDSSSSDLPIADEAIVADETTSTPPSPITATLSERIAKMVAERSETMEIAEQLLEHSARGNQLTVEQMALLASIGIDRKALEKETRRIRRVHRLQADAGTATEQEDAKDAAAKAAERLATEGAEIRQGMKALQVRLADLELTARRTEAKVAQQQQAVATLTDSRELLPKYFQDTLAALRREHKERFAVRWATMDAELQESETLYGIDVMEQPQSAELAAARVRDRYPDILELIPVSGSLASQANRRVNPSVWAQYLADRRQADEERRAKIAAIQAEPEAVELQRQMDAIQRRYVPQ